MKVRIFVSVIALMMFSLGFVFVSCYGETQDEEPKAPELLVVDMSNVVWSYQEEYIFDGEVKTVQLLNLPTEVSVSYHGEASATDAGTYFVEAEFNVNEAVYRPVEKSSLSWKISKARVENFDGLAPSINSVKYDGQEHVVEVLNIPRGAKIEAISGNVGTDVNNYTIELKLVNSDKKNYEDFGEVDKTISWAITPKELTITANDQTVTFNEEPTENGYSYDGLVAGEKISDVLKGEMKYNFNYTKGDDVGSYKITPSGVSADNYLIEFVSGKLNVEKAKIDLKNLVWNNENQYTYTENMTGPTLINTTGLTVKYTYFKNGIESQIDGAGSYTAHAEVSISSKNYELINSVPTCEFTVIENTPDSDIEIYISICGIELTTAQFDETTNTLKISSNELSIDNFPDGFVTIEYFTMTNLVSVYSYDLTEELGDTNFILELIELNDTMGITFKALTNDAEYTIEITF